MTICNIMIPDYLSEYIKGIYNNGADEPIRIPDDTDLYHLIWNLMRKRPTNIGLIDKGNLSIILPERRIGKDPLIYNYLPDKAQHVISAFIKKMFDTDLHETMMKNYSKESGLRQVDIVTQFLGAYCIESISEDAILKNYYRWRENRRKRIVRNSPQPRALRICV